MAVFSPASPLDGRIVALAGEPGALNDQVAACLDALGAVSIRLQSGASTGPRITDLKVEDRVTASLDRAEAALDGCDAVVFVGRDLSDGEDMGAFIEGSIGGYHFCLKLAMRLRAHESTDVVALAGASAEGELPALAADIRNGALRQMTLVAASEGGPLSPPLLANAVRVAGEPGPEASASLTALLARLLGRPQGYVTGTELSIRL
ncbi:MAG: hypothetical protein OXP09_14675 [Gammaproteobacteria bacterium]|nr:hypothetical protein [Gammaproteobacteria bacterium]MDE0366806.1 hypothetical protein [Gammaproteobacteria bacterium]